MSSIPPARPARESALSSYLSGHRQVDLAAKSFAATERLRKKKETEAQVREAIANARKPNRPMATKEVAARADEKFAQTLPRHSRTSRPQQQQQQPPLPPQQPSIHVAATPKKRSHGSHATTTSDIPASTHSSNPSVVPASSIRPRLGPSFDNNNNNPPTIPQSAHRNRSVEETPSRNSSSRFAFLSPTALRAAPISFPAALAESPTARRSGSHVAATPVKMVGRRVDFGVVREGGGGGGNGKEGKAAAALVEATPVKASPGGIFGKRDGGGGDDDEWHGNGNGEGKSIYDAWNDDYEELA